MSLISYKSVILNESTTDDRNMDHVLLENWVTRGTRKSMLGVGVVYAGIVTIVFRVIFAVYSHRHNENFIQLAASP